MQKRKVFRILLQIFATAMFLYQMSNAVKLLNEIPMMVSTETLDIKDITAPSMVICNLGQYNKTKMLEQGYYHEWLVLNGILELQWNESSWGSHLNTSYDQLVRRIVDLDSLASIEKNNTWIKWKKILFPKYGICLRAMNYSVDQQYIRISSEVKHDVIVYLTDVGQGKYYGVGIESQMGDKIKILKDETLTYSFKIKVSIYNQQAAHVKDDCNKDENYNYGECVEEETIKDLYPKMGCIPEWLSMKMPCKVIPLNEYFVSYADNYYYLQQTAAEKKCKDPCFRQTIEVHTLDISPNSATSHSDLRLGFDQKVVKYTKLPNYNFFNFLIDAGSSMGLWLGFSALSLYDSGFDFVLTFRRWVRCK